MSVQDPWSDGNGAEGKKSYPVGGDKNLEEVLKRFKNGFGFSPRTGPRLKKMPIFLLVVILICLYCASGFYIVQPDEEGIELLFGRYQTTNEPGLRYHLPFPIAKVIKVKVKAINREEIGSRLYSPDSEHGEGVMLTGDENILNINFEVQWRINDAYKYLFEVRDNRQGASVKNAAESAMREVVGKSTIAFAIEGKGRASIAQETKVLLQKILDQYQMGVEILSIQLKKVDPPEKVISAFRDVQSARADKERLINEARSYSNDILPRAKGEAMRIKKDSEGYESEVVNTAEGDAQRFSLLYDEYKNQPKAVKDRMYIETMESILAGAQNKVVVSDELKGLMSYLPLADLGGGK